MVNVLEAADFISEERSGNESQDCSRTTVKVPDMFNYSAL